MIDMIHYFLALNDVHTNAIACCRSKLSAHDQLFYSCKPSAAVFDAAGVIFIAVPRFFLQLCAYLA